MNTQKHNGRTLAFPPTPVDATFGYDAENRVTSLSHGSFINRVITRDARGYKTGENIITGLEPVMTNGQQKLTHNAADQLTHIDQRDTWFGGELNQWYNRDYTYDPNGTLLREAVTRPFWNTNTAIHEYTVNYTYDYDNRLSSVSSATSVVNYLYDASGARIARIAGISPAITNYFVLDYKAPLKMPLAEADALGRITRYYVWGTQGLLCHLDTNPTNGAVVATRYYHADELGSTLALTDSSGTLTDQFAYSPHGEVLGRTGSTDTPYLWLGGLAVRSEGAGLYFMLNRYYSADLRRFLSIDPSGIDSFPNLYAYANLNPLAFVDPSGLWGLPVLTPGQAVMRDLHWNRNELNNAPALESETTGFRDVPEDQMIFHRQGAGNENNVKLVAPSTFFQSEGVYNPSGQLVTDPLNRGTLNVVDAKVGGGIPHAVLDVLPYVAWGNGPDDPSSPWDRAKLAYQELKDRFAPTPNTSGGSSAGLSSQSSYTPNYHQSGGSSKLLK